MVNLKGHEWLSLFVGIWVFSILSTIVMCLTICGKLDNIAAVERTESYTYNIEHAYFDSYTSDAVDEPMAEEYSSYQESLLAGKAGQSHEFTVTHYCGCAKCCGQWSGGSESEAIGASGIPLIPGKSVAVDTRVIPLGTVLWDEDGNEYYAMDTGSGVNGYRIDLFTGCHNEAVRLGVQTKILYW